MVYRISRNRPPGNSGMATGAGRGTGDMRVALAGGNGAVVTGNTGADHLRMIHFQRRLERSSHMTTLATVAASDVTQILASRIRAVMA